MIANQKGNALITVLLISLIFTTLGLAIVSSSISGAKRVENRETDINLSFNAVKVVEEVSTNISKSLQTINLDQYMSKTNGEIKILSSFDPALKQLLEAAVAPILDNKTEKAKLECLTLVDESGAVAETIGTSSSCLDNTIDFPANNIETDKDFTRVFEIILITKNPNQQEGQIKRTIRKRIILSPLPSFLKYAVGSYSDEKDSGLILNGSPNIKGNVYANRLTINEEANYELDNSGNISTIKTPLPSIIGDVYSSTANLIPIMKQPEKFYRQNVPSLKHDSQFVNIDFPATFNDQANNVLYDGNLTAIQADIGSAFQDELIANIRSKLTAVANNQGISWQGTIGSIPSIIGHEDELNNGYKIESNTDIPAPIIGDAVIMSPNNDITLSDDLYVDGDLYVLSYHNINLQNVYVTGNIYLANSGGNLSVDGRIYCGNNLSVETTSTAGDLNLNGDIITGQDLLLKSVDTPIDINQNMVINGALSITGNDELDSATAEAENDSVVFDSVVYVGDTASISNVNIVGADDNAKELVLLVNHDLMITRMNEFKNFNPVDEKTNDYMPSEEKQIKPLKAFFYTEDNALLYGVGSLFYIDGGLFANKRLEINAIRGEVTTIKDLNQIQDGRLSRFIVNFNSDVLLHRVEALPIVKQLQIYSDELIIE